MSRTPRAPESPMTTLPRALGSGWLLAISLCLAACGGLREPPAAPEEKSGSPQAPASESPVLSTTQETAGDAEPATLAEAERLLEKARQDLDRWAQAASGVAAVSESASGPPSQTTYAPAPREAAPAPAPKKSAGQRAAADDAAPASAPEKTANSCDTACKAFSSLERASAAVCRLEADGGPRCQRARQIREDAARRVASCGCAQ